MKGLDMISFVAILLFMYDISRGKGYISGITVLFLLTYSLLIGAVIAPVVVAAIAGLGCFKLIGGKITYTFKGRELISTPGFASLDQTNRSLDEQLKKVDQMLKEAEGK